MIQHILKVEGMTCQHCEQSVKEALSKMSGVQCVEVQLDAKTVTVDFDESLIQLSEISDQIIELGFEVP
jgi:copper chaperone